MGLIEFSTRRAVTVFIFAVAAVLFGIIGFRNLATDLLPDITYPSLTVRTDYEGAAPAEIEGLLTRPVENAVGVVNNVVHVSSSSRTGVSEVTLEFRWGTDMDLAALDARERLDLLRLPDAAERPVLLRYDPSLDPIQRLALRGGDDLFRLRLIAEDRVKRAVERVEGVAAAVVSGGLEEEIQIELDERKLANLGLSVARVIQRVEQENIDLTGGRLLDGQTEYLVRTLNELARPGDLEQVVVDTSGGASVRLRDIAHVVRGAKERELIMRVDGEESVEIAVYKEGGTNTVLVSDRVRENLDELARELSAVDPSLKLSVITDQAQYIRSSVDQVLQTALWGGLLAIAVLFLFLRSWKTTLIVGAAIPISVVATFFLMYLAGVSLNIMSLGGLTLGIGLLVDNSIVVLEAIQRRRDDGLNEIDAAREGANEVARAVVASTLTTICVFVPIVFVEGIAGQLFGDQALTVTFSLVISLLVALTVIPMLASRRFTAPPAAGEEEPPGLLARIFTPPLVMFGRLLRTLGRITAATSSVVTAVPLAAFGGLIGALTAIYRRTLAVVLRHPLVTVLVALVLFGSSLMLFPRLGRELVPELIQGEFYVDLELPPGTHLDVTQRRLDAIERRASKIAGVARVYSTSGSSNEQGGSAGELRENIGQITLTLEPPISRAVEEDAMRALRNELDRQPELSYRFGRPSYFSFRTPIEVEIRGPDLQLLERLADESVRRLSGIDGLSDLRSSTEGGTPELGVRFDRGRLAAYGLSVREVADTLRTKIQGTIATDVQRDDRTIDIRLRADESYRDSVAALMSLNVHQQGRVAIPLSAVAEITERIGPAEIRRAEGERAALVTANLAGRDLNAVADEITERMSTLQIPAAYDWALGGQRREMETSFGSMRLAIFLAIFMVYLVMASQFESLLHPLVILFSVPFSLTGVLLTLWLFDVNVSVVVLIGTILLAGIVVNNAILLVDATNRYRKNGMDKLAALKRAGEVRLRPILMTTATTVLGLLPMAIGLGAGSELRRPMALPVIGGLVMSTLLTLLVLPSVYRLLDRSR